MRDIGASVLARLKDKARGFKWQYKYIAFVLPRRVHASPRTFELH